MPKGSITPKASPSTPTAISGQVANSDRSIASMPKEKFARSPPLVASISGLHSRHASNSTFATSSWELYCKSIARERAGRYRLRNPNFSVFDREGNLYFSDSGAWRKEDGFLFVLRPNGKIEE